MHKYLVLFLIIGISNAGVLLTNGDFEEPLATGWFQGSSGSGFMTIVRETYYDPDPDYEVFVHKGDETGSIKLFQTVVIPTTDLEFSVNAKLMVYGTSNECWSGAGVCIWYLDASNVVLGSSKICARTVACPWQSNNSCHVIAAIDTLWNNYAFNIDDELVNVPAVNGSDVAKIQVSLLAQCVDDWGDTEWAKVFADDIVLNYTGTEPYVSLLGTTIYDAGGNNNGRLDPGETVDLTSTLRNTGAVDFTGLSTTIECSDPYITITDNAGYFGSLAVDSIKENTGDPYVVSADPSTPTGHIAEFNLIADDGGYVDTLAFVLIVGNYHYLVWNADPTPVPGQRIDSILCSLGYTGEYSTDLLGRDDLDLYYAIFVCVGIFANNYIIGESSSEASALVDYLNNGGHMYLEGGDVWYYDPLYQGGYDFGPLFGIQAVSDGSGDLGPVVGESGTFTDQMNFNYTGENSWIDHINATGTGFVIFHDGNNNYNCGVANDAGTYKTVGSSFELGGLVDGSGVSTRAVLLDSIMHFFGIFSTGIDEVSDVSVKAPILKLYPNPFSKLMTISFGKVHGVKSIDLKIYDATGRLVKDFSRFTPDASRSTFLSWDGRDDSGHKVSSGIYFVTLETENFRDTKKVIVVE